MGARAGEQATGGEPDRQLFSKRRQHMIPVPENMIGGALVRRRIDRSPLPPLNVGDRMTREEVLALPVANRRALINIEALWLSPLAEPPLAEAHIEAPRRGRPPNHK